MASALSRPALLVLLAVVLGCSSSELLLPETPGAENVALSKLEGDNQEGIVGEPLPAPVVVQAVTVVREHPATGRKVEFVTASESAEVGRDTAITDSQGRATLRPVLGTAPGNYLIQARLLEAEGDPQSQEFVARAKPGPPHTLTAKPPTSRPGRRGDEFNPAIQLVDRFGNSVPEVSVAWSVESGGGAVSDAISLTDITGTASVKWTLGRRPGVHRLTAAVGPGPVDGSPVSFTATVLF